MPDLRLPKLPDRTPVKITISVSPDLSDALTGYAALYHEAYGQAEPAQELIRRCWRASLEATRRSRGGGERADPDGSAIADRMLDP